MKKTFGLILSMLLIVGMIPLTAAITAKEKLGLPSKEAFMNDDGMDMVALENAVVEYKENMPDEAGCEEKLKKEFPNATPERIAEACQKHEEAVERISEKLELNKDNKEAWENKKASLVKDRMQKIDLSPEEITKLKTMSRAEIKAYAEKNSAEIKEQLKKMQRKVVSKEDLYRKRVLTQSKVKEAEENYKKAKERYQLEKKSLSEERTAWKKALEEGDEELALEHAKEYLIEAANSALESLESVKARVEGNDDLTEEEVQEILSEIEEKKELITNAKTEVENAETKEELKEAANKVLHAWKLTKEKIAQHVEKNVQSKVGEILVRSERLEVRIDKTLTQISEKGIEITGLEDQLDEFSGLVENAKEKFEEAKTYFEDYKTTQDKETLEKSKGLAREAHETLKEAHAILADLIKDLRKEWKGPIAEEDEEVIILENPDDDGILNPVLSDEETLSGETTGSETSTQ